MLPSNSLFLIDVLPELPKGLHGPWGIVLVEVKFIGGQQSLRNKAAIVALAFGRRRWGALVPPLTFVVPRACTCDLAELPNANYEGNFGRAWVLSSESQALIHLIAGILPNSKRKRF